MSTAPRTGSRLAQIAEVLNIPIEVLHTGSASDRGERSLAEDVLTVGRLLASLKSPVARRECVALVESFVAFRTARGSGPLREIEHGR